MTSDECDELMRQSLASAGFDYSAPDLRLAWDTFKTTLDEALEVQRCSTVGYSCHNAADHNDVLWLFWGRQFDDGPLASSGCLFSTVAPKSFLGINDENWWWIEHLSLAAWIEEVETNQVFRECMKISGWKCEGFNL